MIALPVDLMISCQSLRAPNRLHLLYDRVFLPTQYVLILCRGEFAFGSVGFCTSCGQRPPSAERLLLLTASQVNESVAVKGTYWVLTS